MIKKLLISENTYLQEDIAAVKKYYPNIDDDTFMQLISLDPTYTGKDSVGKYGKWLLNLYNKGKLSEEQFNEVTPLLDQFTTYRNRIQNKDLNAYKSLDELAEILASVVDDMSMLTPRQKTKFLKQVKSGKVTVDKSDDYDVVLDTPSFIVFVPNTHEASMKLGKGTSWCTAHENPDWYNNYTEGGGKLYIVKDKKTGERWQYSDKNGDFLDQYDHNFDIPDLMQQDEKLSKFFAKFLGVDYCNFDGTWVYNGNEIPYDFKSNITKIVIDDSVTSIGSEAFRDCTSITSITIPDSVKDIDWYAFQGCSSLASIKIPNSVTSIGEDAFKDCTSLTNVTIGNSVTDIGGNAFQNCTSLTSITIGNSVTSIGNWAFDGCTSLSSIKISDSVTSIGGYAFYDCKNLTSITIPNSVTIIGGAAFQKCTSLKSINIPNSVTSIGKCAFLGCTSLSSIMIPDSVTSISYGAFWNCTSLTVYTDNQYVIDYCNRDNIPVKPLKSKNESYKPFRLKIREY